MKAEELFKICGALCGEIFDADGASAGDCFGGVDDEAGLVALAAMRCGREVRGIGFEQQAISGSDAGGFADFGGFRERGDSPKGQMEAEIETFARRCRIACEAVHDAGQAGGRPMRAENVEGVSPGVAGVNDDGHSGVSGDLELSDEHRGLRFFRHAPVIIESDLADGFEFRMPEE